MQDRSDGEYTTPENNRRRFTTRIVVTLAGMLADQAHAQPARPAPPKARFDFAIMSDMPYTAKPEEKCDRLLKDTKAGAHAFVAHVGDMMLSPRPCARVAPRTALKTRSVPRFLPFRHIAPAGSTGDMRFSTNRVAVGCAFVVTTTKENTYVR